jgi:hypothetical protein
VGVPRREVGREVDISGGATLGSGGAARELERKKRSGTSTRASIGGGARRGDGSRRGGGSWRGGGSMGART